MLNWQGWAANFLGWGATGTTPAPAPVTGGGGKRKPIHYVEIEGKVHTVDSAEEAAALLEDIRNETQRTIAKRIAKPKTTAAEHIVDIPAVTVSSPDPAVAHRLQAQVDAYNANMRRLQAEAKARYEAEIDDQEVIAAFMKVL